MPNYYTERIKDERRLLFISNDSAIPRKPRPPPVDVMLLETHVTSDS